MGKFTECRFAKIDDVHPHWTYVLGIALALGDDYQGDRIDDPAVLEYAAHNFMEKSQRGGVMHEERVDRKAMSLVESYIARCDMQIGDVHIPKHSWVVGFRVRSPILRSAIVNGELRGFSIGGACRAEDLDEDD